MTGRLRLVPGLRVHDATVISVQLGVVCSVEFRRLEGSHVRLVMLESSEFGVVGLRNSAIVSTVQVFVMNEHANEVAVDHWRTLVGGEFAPSAADIASLSRTARLLVGIDCSFGGALAVMCDAARVEEIAS